MNVLWLEQSPADVSAEDSWLSAWERSCLDNLRIPKRYQDWRLGRWTAKHAVAGYLHLPHDSAILSTIQLRPDANGAPQVVVAGLLGRVSLSLSHRSGVAVCAVGMRGAMLGCDLELVEQRSHAFVSDYLTAEEQTVVRQTPQAARFALINLIWSAKESALKAIRIGLRSDPRCVSVELGNTYDEWLIKSRDSAYESRAEVTSTATLWEPLRVTYAEKQVFQGWWLRDGPLIRTLVSIPAVCRPVQARTVSEAVSGWASMPLIKSA